MRSVTALSTELFGGTEQDPQQILAVTVDGIDGSARIVVSGKGVAGEAVTRTSSTDVPLRVEAEVGTIVPIRVHVLDRAGELTVDAELVVAEPGWTMYLISHFHYDPVWWATQAAYAVTWNDGDDAAAEEMARRFQMGWQQPGFTLIDAHLDLTRRDPNYKFVLAEVDLLKPYWDARPEQRSYLRTLVAEGRLELLGGTYNEPNTNLTSAEVTIRNFVYGSGFQRDVFGADPRTAWQLDAFGHDPQFPGLAADAGITSSSWARGPFRPWGPMLTAFLPGAEGWGDPRSMQFDSEFEWIAPSGAGVLTHYMPAHYSAGWVLDRADSLPAAEAALLELFTALKGVAATRNVLLPVGTDYTPPNRWITDIHRHWNDTYVWPRFVCALPSEFFAAVRAELDAEGRRLSPQTRDMNPIFTGKDVSFIDTKQAHRAAETALVDAEKFATFARAHGAGYPHAALDKAWRHLVYGAHHDAVTGSESDQVYLDLMTNWREALDLAESVRDGALAHLSSLIRTGPGVSWAVTVFNPSSWPRTDLARVCTELPSGAVAGEPRLCDDTGQPVPAIVEVPDRHPDGTARTVLITFLAQDVPCLGYRSWVLDSAGEHTPSGGWHTIDAAEHTIESDRYCLTVDPERGGGVASLFDKRDGRELVAPGEVGNVLLRTDEYAEHPTFNEGPWHLLPTGRTLGSDARPADRVRVQESRLGRRIVVDGQLGEVRFRQTLTLWSGIDRLDCRTELHDFAGADQLFRVRWPAGVAGAMPVSEVGHAVVGRGHAFVDADSAEHPWTLDNPAYGFFALSSTARVRIVSGDGVVITRAVNTAEVVCDDGDARDLAVALVRCGVTATTASPAGPRYGTLAVDSNLPDVRISVGTPSDNAFTAAVLADAPDHAAEFVRQLDETGSARVWVPALVPLAEVWQPSADLRAERALPVLLVAGPGAVDALVADLGDTVVDVAQQPTGSDGTPDLDDATVGLVNRGTPGFAVDTAGALHLSLMRSCTGWPSGVWIDPPARTTPDGSAFQQQHWSHAFDYAVTGGAGDWRTAGMVRHAHDVNHPLLAHLHRAAGAELPAAGSFLSVESEGTVVVSAVKAAGNPLAAGGVPGPDADSVAIRLYEAHGQPATTWLSSTLGLHDPKRCDLLERPGASLPPGSPVPVNLAPGETVTIGATLGSSGAAHVADRVFVEPHQPVYARYWLNNTGTAPVGNLPVAVHWAQDSTAGDAPFELTATVASSLTDHDAAGTLTVEPPAGWVVEPKTREYVLGPGRHLRFDVRVIPPDDAPAGSYLLPVRVTHGGQVIEDLCRVHVGGAGREHVGADLLESSVHVMPGTDDVLTVRLCSDAATSVSAQVQLITPFDVWPLVTEWNTGALVPAHGSVEVPFRVRVPHGSAPGRWWAIAKVAAAGRVHFTDAVELVVSSP